MRKIKEVINNNNQQLGPDYYVNFLHKNSKVIIDTSRVNLSLLCDEERKTLQTPVNGDSSLVLRYREKEGAIISTATISEELSVLQLQGAKNNISYKVSTGIDWINLFSDQLLKITSCDEKRFRLITMPSLTEIDGLYEENATEMAVGRYLRFANILGLRFSKEDDKYVKELGSNLN
jgi:hypothetical protein